MHVGGGREKWKANVSSIKNIVLGGVKPKYSAKIFKTKTVKLEGDRLEMDLDSVPHTNTAVHNLLVQVQRIQHSLLASDVTACAYTH